MTPEEFIDLVWSVSYKPGYLMQASQEGGFIRVDLHVGNLPDVANPAIIIKLTFTRSLSCYDLEHQGKEFARYWLKRFVREWEDHEMAEWLKIDGERIFEPTGH